MKVEASVKSVELPVNNDVDNSLTKSRKCLS